jgi:hypothetical protein
MTDLTTEGYTATAAEIDGMVRNLCAYALGEPDPLIRYADLTHQQVLFDGIVAAIRRERGRALADLIVAGTPVDDVAKKTNLATPARVRKLISAAGETQRVTAATARRPAKRSRTTAPPSPALETVPPMAAGISPATATDPAAPTRAAATPPQVAAPTGKRVLTAAERVALGLPADGPIPRARSRRRRDKASV